MMNTLNSARRNRQRQTPKRQKLQNVEHALRMSTTRVGGPNDPPPVQKDVVVTKIVQIETIPKDNASYDITYAIVAGAIPTCFDMLRIVKISVWAQASSMAKVSITVNGDGAQYSDYGTQGSRRPQIHLSPPFTIRQSWQQSSSTAVVASVTSAPVNEPLLIHVTAEFRSTASGS